MSYLFWAASATVAAGAFAWFDRVKVRSLFPMSKYHAQAVEDQKKADYPGCPHGLMQCRAFCECSGTTTKTLQWVDSRAKNLEKLATCKHDNTVPFRPSMFPGIETGSRCLECGAVKKRGESTWEFQN